MRRIQRNLIHSEERSETCLLPGDVSVDEAMGSFFEPISDCRSSSKTRRSGDPLSVAIHSGRTILASFFMSCSLPPLSQFLTSPLDQYTMLLKTGVMGSPSPALSSVILPVVASVFYCNKKNYHEVVPGETSLRIQMIVLQERGRGAAYRIARQSSLVLYNRAYRC